MTIEQTVEIPADRRLHLELDLPETTGGKARVTVRFPVQEDQPAEWERTLAVLKRGYGAWKDTPWENYEEDLQALRSEWDHRDFWNHDQQNSGGVK
jgi:hypothetical protein